MKILKLSQGEIESMIILERIKKNELTQAEAAKILKISPRHVRRKLKRYISDGAIGLMHKSRGKASNRAFSTLEIDEIFQIIENKYLHFKEPAGPTFIADQLKKNDGFAINHETLRRYMIARGLWRSSSKKAKHHQWRERKHHVGELVQVDGSYHIWFGQDYSTLIAFIDDATGNILCAEFVDRESTENLATLTKNYITIFGRPLALYSDRGSTYKVNNNKDGLYHKTQYQRMLREADIELIHARSPQAKGRVERLFKTLQDRLVKELELAKITTQDAANVYLKTVYIPEHNAKFSVEPKEKADFHRSIDALNLDSIFCLKFERIINNDYTVCFQNKWFQLSKTQAQFTRRGQRVGIYKHFDGTVDIVKDGGMLVFKTIMKQERKTVKKAKYVRVRELVYHKPPTTHPWRRSINQPDISTELKRGHF